MDGLWQVRLPFWTRGVGHRMVLLDPRTPSPRHCRSLALVYQDGEVCQPGALEPHLISGGRPEQPGVCPPASTRAWLLGAGSRW